MRSNDYTATIAHLNANSHEITLVVSFRDASKTQVYNLEESATVEKISQEMARVIRFAVIDISNENFDEHCMGTAKHGEQVVCVLVSGNGRDNMRISDMFAQARGQLTNPENVRIGLLNSGAYPSFFASFQSSHIGESPALPYVLLLNRKASSGKGVNARHMTVEQALELLQTTVANPKSLPTYSGTPRPIPTPGLLYTSISFLFSSISLFFQNIIYVLMFCGGIFVFFPNAVTRAFRFFQNLFAAAEETPTPPQSNNPRTSSESSRAQPQQSSSSSARSSNTENTSQPSKSSNSNPSSSSASANRSSASANTEESRTSNNASHNKPTSKTSTSTGNHTSRTSTSNSTKSGESSRTSSSNHEAHKENVSNENIPKKSSDKPQPQQQKKSDDPFASSRWRRVTVADVVTSLAGSSRITIVCVVDLLSTSIASEMLQILSSEASERIEIVWLPIQKIREASIEFQQLIRGLCYEGDSLGSDESGRLFAFRKGRFSNYQRCLRRKADVNDNEIREWILELALGGIGAWKPVQ